MATKHIRDIADEEKVNIEELVKYVDYLSDQLNSTISFKNHIVENMSKARDYSDYLGEHVDRLISYNHFLSKHLRINGIVPHTMDEYFSLSADEQERIFTSQKRKIKIKKIIDDNGEGEDEEKG